MTPTGIADLIVSGAIVLLVGANIVLMRRLRQAILALQALAVNVVTFSPEQKPRVAGKVDMRYGPTTAPRGERTRQAKP